MDNVESIQFILPEIILTGFVIVIILADLASLKSNWLSFLAIGGIVCALPPTIAGMYINSSGGIFHTMLYNDGISILFRLIFLIIVLLTVLFSTPILQKWQKGVGEYYALLLFATIGMCFMAGSQNLLMMYLSLEFVSITGYVLSGFLRRNKKSIEASLKYAIYGAVASGVMIYGISYFYGITGTLNIAQVKKKIELLTTDGNVNPLLLIFSGVLVMAGLGYKIASVPFHMWCPDVYEGAPTPITAFLSVGPKAAGFAMLIRFSMCFENVGEWKLIMALMCLLTMAIGNFSALSQNNLKRLMAYSSISQAGFILLGFCVFSQSNISAVIFYLIIYLIMNLGAFLVIILLEEKLGIKTVDGCSALIWREPALCIAMAIFLFSLAGIPPFAGFIAKILIFAFTIEGGAFGIALTSVGAIFSVISLYYYVRVARSMFLAKPESLSTAVTKPSKSIVSSYYKILLWLLAIPTVLFGIWWEAIYNLSKSAAECFLKNYPIF